MHLIVSSNRLQLHLPLPLAFNFQSSLRAYIRPNHSLPPANCSLFVIPSMSSIAGWQQSWMLSIPWRAHATYKHAGSARIDQSNLLTLSYGPHTSPNTSKIGSSCLFTRAPILRSEVRTGRHHFRSSLVVYLLHTVGGVSRLSLQIHLHMIMTKRKNARDSFMQEMTLYELMR